MSEFEPTYIKKPPWFRITPLRRSWGKRERYVIGFDSEASHGKPFLLQFAHPDGHVDLIPTSAHAALIDFLDYLERAARQAPRKRQYIVVGFHLRYEYTQLFRECPPAMFGDPHPIVHDHENEACAGRPKDGWKKQLRILNDKRYAFTIELGRSKRRIQVIDGMAFIKGSLDNAAKVVGVARKLKKPKGLGKRSARSLLADPTFLDYAEQDARITQQVGEKIVAFHERNDIPVSISAPMFAAYSFRRKYLDGEIKLCEESLEEAGLASYHGGKNGFYLDKPAFFQRAYDYDINGAYTSAMAQLPDPVISTFRRAYAYEQGAHALWHVRARLRSCVYRAAQSRSGSWFTWHEDGEYSLWITGYELDLAIERGEIEVIECDGFVMEGPSGGSLRRFCDDMYEQKRSAPSAEEREMAKLCLNSIYGKFIQKVPADGESVYPVIDWNDDGSFRVNEARLVDGGYRAGGLYHPAIASLITGYVRAIIHRLEHKYQSIMTSTDGFLSLIPPDPADVGPEMGKLKVKQGTLRVWRERLYWFHSKEGNKYALHGFRGRLSNLKRIPLLAGMYGYSAKVMIGLRQSLVQVGGKRYLPGTFVTVPFFLDISASSQRSPLPP